MSEKIYRWLLRLYPSQFRNAYGDDALQLFRDRRRDETGFPARVRFWLDLVADFANSAPGEYRRIQPKLASASGGAPSFAALQGESPRPEALAGGGVLAMLALAAFWFLFSHAGTHVEAGAAGHSASFQEPAPQASGNIGAGEEVKLDAADRRRILDVATKELRQYYVDPAVARKVADELLADERKGDDDGATDGEAFAALVTGQMRDVSHDMHLVLAYSQTVLPGHLAGPTPEDMVRYRQAMEETNCTFEKIGILPHKVGYLKLNSFPDPSVCRSMAVTRMASLNDVGAIIFDLRDNRGGSPEMVALIGAYLFDHPEYWYNPRENTSERSWTQSPVRGSNLADKPVYVLTSARTASAAEQFCFNLKMLKRATLVGERTRGSAHSGVFHRIDDHFGIGIPEVRAINPYSKDDWEGTGVEPDVKVNAEDALKTAEKLAESRLR